MTSAAPESPGRTPPDSELLRRFVSEREEAAFAELVQRYVDFVYSAAMRQLNGDAHLARDVAQQVFVDLARKAAQLADRPALAGWLFTSTRYAAAKAVRAEQRRRKREQEAAMTTDLADSPRPEIDWARVRPVLDEILAELPDRDRDAILLRFFGGEAFAAIGARFGIAENAARMRVDRALDRLRVVLSRRGIDSTCAALAAMLASQGVVAAPAGLAATIANAVAAAPVAASVGAGITLMGMTKLQLGLVTAVAVSAVGGVWWQQTATSRLESQRDELRQQNQALAGSASAPAQPNVVRLLADPPETATTENGSDVPAPALNAGGGDDRPGVSAVVGPTVNAFDVSDLDEVPAAVERVAPKYPYEQRRAGIDGDVLVDFVVDADGTVRDVRAVNATHSDFAVAAVEAVRQWKFRPGRKAGAAVNARIQQPITFTMAAENPPAGTWFQP